MEKFQQKRIQILDRSAEHAFLVPSKKINEGEDVTFFLRTRAYADIMTFILQLNASVFPHKIKDKATGAEAVEVFELNHKNEADSSVIGKLQALIAKLNDIIEEAPPDPGSHRFGNPSFRKWHEIVKERCSILLEEYLPSEAVSFPCSSESNVTAKAELEAYFLGSFGSAQRLDYGTGHELSFLAFLGGLWKLGGFPQNEVGEVERAIILKVFEPYLELVRKLILKYRLEPAGSHGVWGLDDHSFLPYVFGSAQMSPAIRSASEIVAEGSIDNAPDPTDVAKKMAVERERGRNMYFSAIGFIYDVKKGPFGEHSPILYDISGVKAGWAKINKGMIKMYNAEVLSKYPVVQHFPFGSLFEWRLDPSIPLQAHSAHVAHQPSRTSTASSPSTFALRDPIHESTRAPWTPSSLSDVRSANTLARAPTHGKTAGSHVKPSVPGRNPTQLAMPATSAPWAQKDTGTGGQSRGMMPPTVAPWASRHPVATNDPAPSSKPDSGETKGE